VRRALIEPLARACPTGMGPRLLRKACSYVAQASVPLPARYDAYNLLERLGPEEVFTADFLSTVDREIPHRLIANTYHDAHAGHWLNRLLAVDLKFTLADNDLPKVTRMCELAQVDVAFPLLHDSVVDFSASLAPNMKLRGTRLRYFFKEALRGFLPDAIIEKEKHGFGLPVGPWLASHAPLREFAAATLESLKRRGIIRREFIDELLTIYLPQHPGYYGTLVWVLMMLELWFQEHTAGHSESDAPVHGQRHDDRSAPAALDRAS
jgi:asparagine synthase (glutamine-hydrolysing)